MNVKIFCHSLRSDWNHGNAHFLRGIASELIARGHNTQVFEPEGSWSYNNLIQDRGESAVAEFQRTYPQLKATIYDPAKLNLDVLLEGADLVLVHEWNEHELVQAVGTHRKQNSYKLLFHDTHHRSVTESESMAKYDLSNYDGVLAFGEVIRQVYLKKGWGKRAWTWHEAADIKVFHPLSTTEKIGDLVWVGNWGDDERTAELHEFLLGPVKKLGLKATVYGVRYPAEALRALELAGIQYGGSLSNTRAPEVFAKHRVTVHVPRRPYVETLSGIPTIRVFEALACGIPLISAPWNDSEHLFTPGKDFALAKNGEEMVSQLERVLEEPSYASALAHSGLETVLSRHTCAHRVDELLRIYEQDLNTP